MITELFLEILIAPVVLLLSLLPSIHIQIPEVGFSAVKDIVSGLGWLVPLPRLFPILIISGVIKTGQIAWAILLRVKSFIRKRQLKDTY